MVSVTCKCEIIDVTRLANTAMTTRTWRRTYLKIRVMLIKECSFSVMHQQECVLGTTVQKGTVINNKTLYVLK